MVEEVKLAFRLTFGGGSWIKDKHLVHGYLVGLPFVVVPGICLLALGVKFNIVLLVLVPLALLANLIWFGYAAWSRARHKD